MGKPGPDNDLHPDLLSHLVGVFERDQGIDRIRRRDLRRQKITRFSQKLIGGDTPLDALLFASSMLVVGATVGAGVGWWASSTYFHNVNGPIFVGGIVGGSVGGILGTYIGISALRR